MARNNPDTMSFQQAQRLYKTKLSRAQKAKVKEGMKLRRNSHTKLEIDFPYSEQRNCFRELVEHIVSGRAALEEKETEKTEKTEEEELEFLYEARCYEQYRSPVAGMI